MQHGHTLAVHQALYGTVDLARAERRAQAHARMCRHSPLPPFLLAAWAYAGRGAVVEGVHRPDLLPWLFCGLQYGIPRANNLNGALEHTQLDQTQLEQLMGLAPGSLEQ